MNYLNSILKQFISSYISFLLSKVDKTSQASVASMRGAPFTTNDVSPWGEPADWCALLIACLLQFI